MYNFAGPGSSARTHCSCTKKGQVPSPRTPPSGIPHSGQCQCSLRHRRSVLYFLYCPSSFLHYAGVTFIPCTMHELSIHVIIWHPEVVNSVVLIFVYDRQIQWQFIFTYHMCYSILFSPFLYQIFINFSP